jgi:hypothetical protein
MSLAGKPLSWLVGRKPPVPPVRGLVGLVPCAPGPVLGRRPARPAGMGAEGPELFFVKPQGYPHRSSRPYLVRDLPFTAPMSVAYGLGPT